MGVSSNVQRVVVLSSVDESRWSREAREGAGHLLSYILQLAQCAFQINEQQRARANGISPAATLFPPLDLSS